MKKKEEIITTENKREIIWVVVNAFIGGGLVFFGSFLDGGLSRSELIAAFGAAAVLFLSRLHEYTQSEKREYMNNKVGMFI